VKKRSEVERSLGLLLFVVTILCTALQPVAAEATRRTPDCNECHHCERPSPVNPCLKSQICPRHEVMDALEAEMGPSIVIMDELEKLYVPVRFNHLRHAEMVQLNGGCETCHHFTPPNDPHPECKSCHPTEIVHEDIAQPGLKGAYHRNCLACHEEWDNDTACEICHEKAVPGIPSEVCEHSHYEKIELIELIVFRTEYEEGDKVPFHHRNHSELYERDCVECHQQQSCKRCHVQGEELHPMGAPTETDLHDTCFRCHREEDEYCDTCHGRDPNDLFSHDVTGWPLASYHAGLSCRSCHGQRGAFMKLEPRCQFCHPGDWQPTEFSHASTGVELDEEHREADCSDCHVQGFGTPPDCADCHEDERRYDPKIGFDGS